MNPAATLRGLLVALGLCKIHVMPYGHNSPRCALSTQSVRTSARNPLHRFSAQARARHAPHSTHPSSLIGSPPSLRSFADSARFCFVTRFTLSPQTFPLTQMAPKFGDLNKKTKDLFADDFGKSQ